MWKKVTNSWSLVKASAEVLCADRELLLFPVLSGAAVVLVSASFVVPSLLFGASVAGAAQGTIGVTGVVVLAAFYFSQYFVMIFFNSALVGAAMIRLEGGQPTLRDGFAAAGNRIGSIFGYALIAATVGVVLRVIRRRAGTLGKIVVSLLGVAWSLATYLVVPVLVVEGLGPIEAVKKSAQTFKRTWGEQIAGNVGMGIFFSLMTFGLVLLVVPVMILVVSVGEPVLTAAVGALFAVAFLFLALFASALRSVYTAALYRFATTGEVAPGFQAMALSA